MNAMKTLDSFINVIYLPRLLSSPLLADMVFLRNNPGRCFISLLSFLPTDHEVLKDYYFLLLLKYVLSSFNSSTRLNSGSARGILQRNQSK